MAYAIFDRDKLKSMRSVSGSGRHVDRLQDTPNAQPKVENRELISTEGKTLEQLVGDRLEGVWRRKDSVLCVELFLSASPEYFRPDDEREYGAYDPDRLEAWADLNLQWLRDEFGQKNIVKASLHLDEATPHIHAYFVPVVPDPKKPEREKLNCKKFFGGPSYVMAEWQSKYAEAMAPLGLQRGEPRGEKTQQIDALTMKELYREIGKVGDIRERELAVQQQSEKLEERDRSLTHREYQLDEREAELERQEITVTHRASKLDYREEKIQEREHYLTQRGQKINHASQALQSQNAELKKLHAELARQKQEMERRQRELQQQQRELWARAIASCLLDKSRKQGKLPQPYRLEPREPGEKILWHGDRVVLRIGGGAVEPGQVGQTDVGAIAQWHRQLGGVQIKRRHPQKQGNGLEGR